MSPQLVLSPLLVAAGAQSLLSLLGLAVLWRHWQTRHQPPALLRWDVRATGFAQAVILTLGCGALAQTVLVNTLGGRNDTFWQLIVPGGGFQFGVLAGAVASWLFWLRTRRPEDAPAPAKRPILQGVGIFVAVLPVTAGASFLWLGALDLLGIEAPKQDLIELFAKADRPGPFLALSFVAIILAPLTEEVVFRGGLYRFCRGRLPRPLALMLPAAVFAALHVNLASFFPLMILGALFSLAYEKTGRIIVPITAHALFNLNTILLVLCGATQ